MSRVIGITGGMAVGKSTIARELLKFKDLKYVDVDQFRRSLFSNDSYVLELKNVIPELRNHDYVDSNILNRYIYSNDLYMMKYKEIMYRYLRRYIDDLNGDVLVDWALIFNDGLGSWFDKIIYVKASVDKRLERLDGGDLPKTEVLRRFKLQEIDDKDINMDKVLVVNNENTFDINEVLSFIDGMECKFTLPDDGGKAIWEITHKCNYGCSYCIFSCKKNGRIDGELTTDECFHIIDELAKHDFKHLKITGGEPFIRRDIIEILRYASSKLITDISTNASLITEEKVRMLNELKLKMIHVSLDGNMFEHESVRGEDTYLKTIRGLKLLEQSINKVRIGAVIHANNERNLEGLVKDSNNVSADEIIFSIMEPVEGQDRSLFKKRSTDDLISELDELKDKYKGRIVVNYNFGKQPVRVHRCPAGDKFLYISNFGNVSPCPWVHEVDKSCISEVSLRDHSLDEVLKDKRLVKFLETKGCGRCYGKI